MGGFAPVSDFRAIRQRIGFTHLDVNHVGSKNDGTIRVGVEGVEDVEHALDLFRVLWNSEDAVSVHDYDADSGRAVIEMVEDG